MVSSVIENWQDIQNAWNEPRFAHACKTAPKKGGTQKRQPGFCQLVIDPLAPGGQQENIVLPVAS